MRGRGDSYARVRGQAWSSSGGLAQLFFSSWKGAGTGLAALPGRRSCCPVPLVAILAVVVALLAAPASAVEVPARQGTSEATVMVGDDGQPLGYIRVASWSADGSRLAFISDAANLPEADMTDAWVYDIPTDTYIPVGSFSSPSHLLLSADGQHLAIRASQTLYYSPVGGTAINLNPQTTPYRISDDGATIVAIASSGGWSRFDTATGQRTPVPRPGGFGFYSSPQRISSDGRYFVGLLDGAFAINDATTGTASPVLTADGAPFTDDVVALSGDGSTLLATTTSPGFGWPDSPPGSYHVDLANDTRTFVPGRASGLSDDGTLVLHSPTDSTDLLVTNIERNRTMRYPNPSSIAHSGDLRRFLSRSPGTIHTIELGDALDPAADALTITPSYDPAPNADGRFSTPVTVTWTVNDPTVTAPAPVTVTGNGLDQPVVTEEVCNAAGVCGFGATSVSIIASDLSPLDTTGARYVQQALSPSCLTSLLHLDFATGDIAPEDSFGCASMTGSGQSLSPDGTRLALGSLLYTDSRRLSLGYDGAFQNRCGSASWSPDGTQLICFPANSNDSFFYVFDVTPTLSSATTGLGGMLHHRLPVSAWTSVAGDSPGAWMRDGVIFPISNRDNECAGPVRYPRTLHLVDPRSDYAATVLPIDPLDCSRTLSAVVEPPQKDRLALLGQPLAAGIAGPDTIWVAAADGTGSNILADESDVDGRIVQIAWTADGQAVVATVHRTSGYRALVQIDVATGDHVDIAAETIDPRTAIQRFITGTAETGQPYTIQPGIPATVRTGIAYRHRLTSVGGTAPHTWTLTAGTTLPDGLSLAADGTISGFASGVVDGATADIPVTDAHGRTATAVIPLAMTEDNHLPVVTTGGPYTAVSGDSRTLSATATDADNDPVTWSWDLDGDGQADPNTNSALVTFDATELQPGDQTTVFAQACDPHGACSRAVTTVTVRSPVAITTASPLPDARVGEDYQVTVEATGGTQPYTFTVSGGALPAGLELDPATGAIAGVPTAAGTFGFTITVTDANGFTDSSPFVTAPTPPLTEPGNPVTVPVVITTPDPTTGEPVAVTCDSYQLAAGSDPLPDGMTIDPSTGAITGTAAVGGTYTIIVECSYTDGGTPATATGEFTITVTDDTTGPTVACTADGTVGLAGWYVAPVTVTCTATDNSGTVTPASQTIIVDDDGDGQVIVSDPMCDPSGNCAAGTVTVSVDQTDPTLTVTASPSPNEHGWHNTPVTITSDCVDHTSGVDSCPAPVTVTGDGADQQVDLIATDTAGNTTTTLTTVGVDTAAPTVVVTGQTDGDIVNADDEVAAGCLATDDLSGLDGDCAVVVDRTPVVDGRQDVTVTATATDRASNTTTVQLVYTVIVDVDAPVITAAFDRDPNEAGWYNAAVDVTFTCEDASPVPDCPAPHTFDTDGANQTTTVTATDSHGNTATLTVDGVNVDTTSPDLTITGARTYSINEHVTVTCTASDSLSGIAFLDCPELDLPAASLVPGDHVVTATAIDVAGNTTEVQATVTVTVTPDSLCDLTSQYLGDGPGSNGLANSSCAQLDAGSYDAYANHVEAKCCTDQTNGNGKGKRFTRAQADILITLAVQLSDQP